MNMDTWPALDDLLLELEFLVHDLEAILPDLFLRVLLAVVAFIVFRRARLSGMVACIVALIVGPLFTAIALGIGHFSGFFRRQRQQAEAQDEAQNEDTPYAATAGTEDASYRGDYRDRTEYDDSEYDESEYDDWEYDDEYDAAFDPDDTGDDDEDPFDRTRRTRQPSVLNDASMPHDSTARYPDHNESTTDALLAAKEVPLIGAGVLLVYLLYG